MYRYKLEQDSESEESAEEECSSPPSKVAKVQMTPRKHEAKRVAQSSMSKEEDDPYGGSTDEEAEPKTIQKPSKLLMSFWDLRSCVVLVHITLCALMCVQWVYVRRCVCNKVTLPLKCISIIPEYG